jgi:eukaryotic-like serine/threonine-protein kinase
MGASASPLVVGRYSIYGKIASGGMASVHFGRLVGAVGFSRIVAVKRLHAHLAEDPEFLSTMIDEARLVARIHHPNVVPTLDVVAADGELLVIMEYVRGESLSRLIKAERARGRYVPPSIASAIVVGALHGLHAAHEVTGEGGVPLGIVHRDVSPQNILVGVDGAARVIDFGVAKAAGRLQTTREGVVKGKVAYMAPEHLTGGEVTRAADVYATGVVLWETLTGRRLFDADNDAQLVTPVLAGAKEPPSHYAPDMPPGLDELVMKALALNPAERFASAQEMADMLRSVAPPAFQTDVSRWVEEVASVTLARRLADLAEIESGSVTTLPPSTSARAIPASDTGRPAASEGGEEARSIASQLSSVTLETPRRNVASSRPARLVGALGVALLLAAGVATLLWRAPTTSGAAVSAPAAAGMSSVNVVPASPNPPPPATSGASEEPAPPPTATSGANATTIARPAPAAPRKPRPGPKPAPSVRFVQPD